MMTHPVTSRRNERLRRNLRPRERPRPRRNDPSPRDRPFRALARAPESRRATADLPDRAVLEPLSRRPNVARRCRTGLYVSGRPGACRLATVVRRSSPRQTGRFPPRRSTRVAHGAVRRRRRGARHLPRCSVSVAPPTWPESPAGFAVRAARSRSPHRHVGGQSASACPPRGRTYRPGLGWLASRLRPPRPVPRSWLRPALLSGGAIGNQGQELPRSRVQAKYR